MPALPSPGKVCRFQLIYTYGEDLNLQNRFFISYTGSISSADLTTWVGVVASAWNAHMAGEHNPGLALVEVNAEDLSSATGAVAQWQGSHVGGDGGNPMPASTCVVLKLAIARRYRGGHPRLYLAGFSESEVNDPQSWKPAFVAGVVSTWTAFIAQVVSGAPSAVVAVNQVNVSYYQGFTNHTFPSGRTRAIPNLRTTPVVDTVTSVSADTKFGAQRRRNLLRS
jgi:hypothetical protein